MRVAKLRAITYLAGIGAIGLLLSSGQPIRAQEVTTSLSAVQECLCAQRAVSVLGDEMRRARQRDDQMHDRVNAMTRDVEEARGRVNTDRRDDIEAFSAMLSRRDQAAQSLRHEDERYSAAVSRYNGAVEQSNRACLGRLFDQEEIESVKTTLVCSRP
jgi:hypothetical protein